MIVVVGLETGLFSRVLGYLLGNGEFVMVWKGWDWWWGVDDLVRWWSRYVGVVADFECVGPVGGGEVRGSCFGGC